MITPTMQHRDVPFSVIVPTFNMAEHLPALARSLAAAGIDRAAVEILCVDDGSTDATSATLRGLDVFRVITLPENQGRYAARLAGARAARGEALLFLDTRVRPGPNFLGEMTPARHHGCAAVSVRIDVARSLFNLYWERTHALIFQRNRRDEAAGFQITRENFDRYVTGTGGFLVDRADFLAACATFGDRDLKSDDTLLLREVAARRPILVRAEWFVWWEPRQNLRDFLARLLERGPGFAEYHLFARRGLYFYVLALCALYLAAGLALVVAARPPGAALLLSVPLGLALTTAAFARGPIEFFKMVPLHVLVCAVAALAVVRGVIVCLRDGAREAA